MIPVLSTSSRDQKGRQGQVCHWKGDRIFGLDICWQKFHWLHTSSRERGWVWVWVLTLRRRIIQRLLRIETGWMVNRWLCWSDTSTLATSAISAISGVLNGLRIKRARLFAEFTFIGSRIFLLGYNKNPILFTWIKTRNNIHSSCSWFPWLSLCDIKVF